jgi:ABC-type transport system involved in multi-copper enzyme maturation permease subunit
MITLLNKELKEILLSPKFIFLSAFAVLLFGIAAFNGYSHYNSELLLVNQEEILGEKNAENSSGPSRVAMKIIRSPEKMQIFDFGISGHMGRSVRVYSANENLTATGNRYESLPILAVFETLDATYIVSIILSLFAILFGHNMISGEKEQGTLKLMLSNSISRSKIILAKWLAGLITVFTLLLIPLLFVVVCLMILADLTFTSSEWMQLGLLAITYMIYLAVIFSLSLAISAMTKTSFSSLLISLSIWVLLVAVVPRVAVLAAGQISSQMTNSEYSSRLSNISKNVPSFYQVNVDYFDEHSIKAEEYENNIGLYFSETIKLRSEIKDEMLGGLSEEWDRREQNMKKLSLRLSAISPFGSLQLAAHSISNSGIDLEDNFIASARQYAGGFYDYKEMLVEQDKLLKKTTSKQISTDGYVHLTDSRRQAKIDISALPRYQHQVPKISALVEGALLPLAVMVFYLILLFAVAHVAFIRYDVR